MCRNRFCYILDFCVLIFKIFDFLEFVFYFDLKIYKKENFVVIIIFYVCVGVCVREIRFVKKIFLN